MQDYNTIIGSIQMRLNMDARPGPLWTVTKGSSGTLNLIMVEEIPC